MNASRFPQNSQELALLILNCYSPASWSSLGAQQNFNAEVGRAFLQLKFLCLHGFKPLYCEEAARLVTMGLVPNVKDTGTSAFDAAGKILDHAGLMAGSNPSVDTLKAEFYRLANSTTPPSLLAQFLNAHWS